MLTFQYIHLLRAKSVVVFILICIKVAKVTFIVIDKIKMAFLTAIKITMDIALLSIIGVFKALINKW